MFSKHTQRESFQEGLKEFAQNRSSADITDNLSNLSLNNHKRLLRSQESARKKVRLFTSPVMESSTPLAPELQQQESIRFMDFLVQTKLDKYPMLQAAAKKYSKAPQTVVAKSMAFAQFEKESQPIIEQEQTVNASLGLANATSNICQQVACISTNKGFKSFATGLSAMTQAAQGVYQISQASALMSQAANGAMTMASGAMMLGAVGAVIAAGVMIYGMCSEEENAGNGLGEALQAIHSAVLEMHQDMLKGFRHLEELI